MVSYKVNPLDLGTVHKGILCHRRNRHCALTATYNYLHLKGTIKSVGLPNRMKETDIKRTLIKVSESNISKIAGITAAEREAVRISCVDAIEKLPGIPKVIPILKSGDDFKRDGSPDLFYYLNIEMVHAWLLDPEDELYKSVEGYCFAELTSHASAANDGTMEKIQHLLDALQNEATAYGFKWLTKAMKDKEFRMLYWDGKFDVIYKHEGTLLMLEANEQLLNLNSNIAWKVWNPMAEDVIYLSDKFVPAKGQDHLEKAKAWYREKLYSKLEEVASSSSSIVPMGAYSYMPVKFDNMDKGIVCDGLKGPCVLTALSNYLHLSGSVFPGLAPEEKFITQHQIKENLIAILQKNAEMLLQSGSYTNDDLYGKKNECEVLINSLPAHLDMLPLPESAGKFKENPGIHLFEFLKVPLFHGLSIDPYKDIYEDIKDLSIPDIRSYLESTRVEGDVKKAIDDYLLKAENCIATADGLVNLQQSLEKGDIAVLYWSGGYCVIHENNGSILKLETNKDFLTKYPQAMWQVLDVDISNNKSVYLDDEYVPAKEQPFLEKAKKWCRAKASQKLRDDLDKMLAPKKIQAASRKPIQQKRTQMAIREMDTTKEHLIGDSLAIREIADQGHSPSAAAKIEAEESKKHSEECISCHSLEDSLTTSAVCEVDTTKEHLIGDSLEDLSMIGSNFLKFLSNFKDGSSRDETTYFEGVLISMEALKSTRFYVPFVFIQKYDMRLAGQIQNHYASISGDLIAALMSYLQNRKIQSHYELEILHLPQPNSQSFVTFVENIELLEEYNVPTEVQLELSPSHKGRQMALGFLHVLVRKFKEGKCLAGKWDETNMILTNGGLDHDIVCEDYELTPQGALDDMKKFHKTVLLRFSRNGRLPPYFEEFKDYFLQIPDCKEEPLKWTRYLMLINDPLALKAPLVRSALICNVYQIADSLRSGSPNVYVPLHKKTGLSDWRDEAKGKYLFRKVYDFDNFSSAWRGNYYLDGWGGTHWSLWQYCRHFSQHVLKYTKNLEGIQLVDDLGAIDIILARELGKFITQSVRYFVMNCDVDGVFSAAWNHFLASECLDKHPKNIDKESKEQVLSEENLVTNPSSPQIINTPFPSASLLVGMSDKKTEFYIPSALLGKAKLEQFKSFLDASGLQAHLQNGDLYCESTCVYKTTSAEQESLGADLIGIQGPMTGTYWTICDLLSSWLNL